MILTKYRHSGCCLIQEVVNFGSHLQNVTQQDVYLIRDMKKVEPFLVLMELSWLSSICQVKCKEIWLKKQSR